RRPFSDGRCSYLRPRVHNRTLVLLAAALQDLQEGTRAQLVEAQSRRQQLLFFEGTAAQATEEVVEQALTGCSIVENVARHGSLRGLLNKVLQTSRRLGK